MRQVSRGRIMFIGEDLADALLAIVSGDTEELGQVLIRTGDSNKADQAALEAYKQAGEGVAGAINAVASKTVLGAAVSLGNAAKGYRWTGTGPDYYDCSGLMYRACQKAGYKGPRFTTSTVRAMPGFVKVASPATQGPGLKVATTGDIVLWLPGQGGPTGHMGVVSGPDQFYSARSVRSGIGYSKISTFRKAQPTYLRFVGTKK